MTRSIPVAAALLMLLAAPAAAQNTQGLPTLEDKEPKKTAHLRYHATQAALLSGLAHAHALESLAGEPGKPNMEIALAYVKEINRDINECRTNSTKMGQAEPSVEKNSNLKRFRSALDEAATALDKAHQAVDGHGELGPPSKEMTGHLRKALGAFLKLADAVGTKPLSVHDDPSEDKGGL